MILGIFLFHKKEMTHKTNCQGNTSFVLLKLYVYQNTLFHFDKCIVLRNINLSSVEHVIVFVWTLFYIMKHYNERIV